MLTWKRNNLYLPVMGAFFFILTGCGGGSSSSSDESNNDKEVNTSAYRLSTSVNMGGQIQGLPTICRDDCSYMISEGENLTLTAVADEGFEFNQWTGACSGNSSCVVTVNQATQVSALFNPIDAPEFTVNIDIIGGGAVSGNPITCSTDCSQSVNINTQLSLSAIPIEGFTFSGWSGDCSGTGDCELVITKDTNITATFTADTTPTEPGDEKFSYIGIPYPDPARSTLPSGIMPSLPAPNSAKGWSGYNPVEITKPAQSDCTTVYGAGDSVPSSITMNAGEVICFADGLATAAKTVAINGESCSSTQPCWVTGYGNGGIYSRAHPVVTIKGQHLIFDELRMDAKRSVFDILGGASYITIRNNTITGDASDGGGAGIDIAGGENAEINYVMIYRNSIEDIGPADAGTNGAEAHQVRPSWYARYVWIVENTFGDSDGDAIQSGNSKTPSTREGEGRIPEKSPHYIWVAGNDHIGVSENFIDNKNSYHVVISENTIHTPMRETVILLSNDGEGFWTGHHWAIANRIAGGGSECIGLRGNEQNFYGTFTDYNYVIGNIAYDCNALVSFNSGNSSTKAPESYILYNTLVSNKSGSGYSTRAPIHKVQNRQESLVEFVGNIIYGNFNPIGASGGDSYIAANGFDITTFKALDNLYFQTTGIDVPFLTGIDSETTEIEGNINANPQFQNESNDDYRLQSGSPGYQATTRSSAAFSRFMEFYGIDIQAQLNLTGTNNIGAKQ